jgi:hypothetical protein
METTDKKELNFEIVRGLMDNLKRELTLNPDGIKYQESSQISAPDKFIDKTDIKGYRYGIKWIQGAYFTFGRTYQIFIQDCNNKILKIDFTTYFGYRRKQLHSKFASIVDTLWDFYFKGITISYYDKFNNNEEFDVYDVHFSKDGITIKLTGIFSEKPQTISWDQVGLAQYTRYFSIYSKDDAVRINRGYSYLNDWNTVIIYSLIDTILKDREAQKSSLL